MRLKTKPLLQLSRLAVLLFTALAAQWAAAFDVMDAAGQRHRLADYKGRWVVVNFWATWCVPCLQEIPDIAAFARERRDVVVLGIAVDAEDNEAKVRQFAKRTGHDYPLVFSNPSVERQLGEPKALPQTRVYDPSGKVVYDRVGRVTQKALQELTPRPAGRKA